jgi:alanine dehydrogenase
MRGLNMYKGTLTCEPVAQAFALQKVCRPAADLF